MKHIKKVKPQKTGSAGQTGIGCIPVEAPGPQK